MTPRFGEVITAMVTPFGRDGALDVKGARSLAAHLADHGSEGLVVCGTTGESPTLSHEEKLTLFENVVEEVGDRCKVIAGTGTYDTEETKALTRAAADRGVHACLVVTPYYSKPPQSSLLQHFRAVADDSPVDVIIYDIPGRTGRRVERATMVQLAAHERIVAVKDAVGDAAETALLRADLDAAGAKDFEIYSGDDIMLLPHLAAGAVGIVSVCAHLVGDRIADIFRAWHADAHEARRLYLELVPLFAVVMGVTSSPIPVKAALGMLGIEVGGLRAPLYEAIEPERDAIRKAMQNVGLL
ncbi:MAG TPA: 4-hydroxy-tetrahydrodipicolinate synthase [Actinomycetota bacterium]|nr:4-hydroxy-tetrahydrodipicolinate synthase [Actinomycetota bacterium]